MKKMKKLMMATLLSLTTAAAMAQSDEVLAFPGAEGYAATTTTGGRGGVVRHVTSLVDDGKTTTTGTFRWAVNGAAKKTVVFDVSGTIQLTKALSVGANTTIAGQTAPGDGICIGGAGVTLGANNIVRFIRFRPGDEGVKGEWDGLGAMDSKNIIVDHCSVSWSIDECLSVYGSTNTTVQWCIASQSLNSSNHSKGNHGYGGNWGGNGASYHHNLIAHHVSRTPRLGPRYTTQTKELMDMRNNVIYNWTNNGCYGGEAQKVNIVNNYYKPGPGTPTGSKGKRIAQIGVRTEEYVTTYPDFKPTLHIWGDFYVTGNVNSKYSDVTNDNWTYGVYNQTSNGSSVDDLWTQTTKDTIRMVGPLRFEKTTTHTAEVAYERVLDYVGCCIKRDALDKVIIDDVRNGTATYSAAGKKNGIINTISEAGGYPELKEETTTLTDTDQDGMPDTWEDANGLDKNDANDRNTVAANGYTNLENYLNSLVQDIMDGGYAGGVVESSDGSGAVSAIWPIPYKDPITLQNNNIYTLRGDIVKANASETDLQGLRKGIYLYNQRKIIVK